jgi:N-acetylneuraminic acid mutarotase
MIKPIQGLRIILLCLGLLLFSGSNAQVWTWMSGTSTVGAVNAYGTQGSASSANTPGARYGSYSWYDGSGNIWIFGGEGVLASGTGRLNDLWKYNISSNQWTWMKGSAGAQTAGIYGVQGTAAASVTPGSRSYGLSWTDNSGNLWLFGGEGLDGLGTVGNLNDLWKYSPTTNEWTWMSGSSAVNQAGLYGLLGTASATNCPGSRRLLDGWKDSSGNLWLFGGYGYDVFGSLAPLNDIWKYTVSSNQWTWMSGSSVVNAGAVYGIKGTATALNQPGARYGHTSWTDNSGNFWMFAGYGQDATNTGYLSDVWKFSPSTNYWTFMGGDNYVNAPFANTTRGIPSATNSPGARHYSCNWTDASGNAYILGGHNGGDLSDLWKYNISSSTWNLIRGQNGVGTYGTKGTPDVANEPGAGRLRSAIKDGSGNFWLFGGVGYDGVGNNWYLNELWKTTLATTTPAADFLFSQTANVCSGTKIKVTDASTNIPVAWTYSLDGVVYTVSKNFMLQDPPTVTIAPGTHTITLVAANSFSFTSVTKTISISSNTINKIIVTPTSTSAVNIGNGQTNNSDWSPWVYSFMDPLPAGAKITRVDFSFSGVDQGWGGSGAGLGLYLAGTWIGSPILTHTLLPYSLSVYNQFPNYVNGGMNSFAMYFVGYPGWQSFIYGGYMVMHYETATVTVCSGKTVTLTATGATTLNWSNGAVNAAPHSPLVSAIYTVTGIETNGCVNTTTASIIVNPTPTVSITGNTVICPGGSAVETANITGSAYSFSWNTGATSNSITVTPTISTTYFAQATHTASGCFDRVPRKVKVSNTPSFKINRSDTVICSGQSVSLAVNQPSNSFAMAFDGSNDYLTAPHSAALDYSTGIDITTEAWIKCTASQSNYAGIVCKGSASSGIFLQMLLVNNKLSAEVSSSTGMIGNGDGLIGTTTLNDGNWHHLAMTINRSSNTVKLYVDGLQEASVTHTYVSGDLSSPLYPLLIGVERTYGIYFNGIIDDVRIWRAAQSQSNIAANMSACLNGTEAGLAAYYNFERGSGSFAADQSTGDNHVALMNMNTATAWTAGKSNCASNFVSYSWAPGGSTSSSITALPATTSSYSLTVTNGGGCSNTAVTNVTVNPLPVLTVNSGNICAGGQFNIVPTGATSYTVSGGSFTVTPAATTSYSVSGTSSLGCVSSTFAVSSVVVNPIPVLTVSGPSSVCAGSAVTETVTGASTYSWNTGATSSILTLSPTTTTAYSITGTSAAGCSTVAIKTITVNPVPVITVNSGSICSGSAFTIIPSGAVTYTYSSGSATVSPPSTTNYSVTGTNGFGCISQVAAVSNVTVNITPTVSVNSGSICIGGSFTITPTGANSYTFVNGASVVSPSVTTAYSINAVSAAGCYAAQPGVATVTVNMYPSLSVTGPGTLCLGASIPISVSGANGYTWSSGQTVSNVTVSPAVNTNYTVTGISAAGCATTSVKSVTVHPVPSISVNSGSVCSGNAFTINPSGAVSYTYSSGSATVIPPATTSYSVTGTNGFGCVSPVAAVSDVTVNITPTVSVNSGSICIGSSFTITPTGANSYTFVNGASVVSPSVTTAYTINAVSAAGCYAVLPGISTVTVNTYPVLSVAGPATLCLGGTISVSVSGANSYSWSTGQTLSNISVNPVSNTNYTVTGTSAAGCVTTSVKAVTVHPVPSISVNSGTLCSGKSYTINPSGALTYTYSSGTNVVSPLTTTAVTVNGVNAFGCSAPVAAVANITVFTTPTVSANSGQICAGGQFTITPTGASSYTFLSGSSVVSPAATTAYSITGASSAGCYAVSPAISNVTVNPLPVLSIAGSSAVCQGASVSQTVSGALSYIWNTGATSSIVTLSPSTTAVYSVTGTNTLTGCVSSVSKLLVVNSLPVISVNSGNICAGSIFTLTPGGAVTYTYSSGSATVAPLSNTSYSVTGTSPFGCVSAIAAVANVIVNPAPAISVNSGGICAGQSFTIQPSGGSSYTVTGGSFVVSPSSTTSFSVTGTSPIGCVSTTPAIATVTVNPIPFITATGGSVCVGSNYTLNPSGAATYTYSGGSGVVSPVVNTTYSITGTSAAGCVASNTAVVVLTISQPPLITVSNATVCAGSVYTLNPSGGVTYTYSSGSQTVIPTSNTNYSVYGMNAAGCITQTAAVAQISVLAQPFVNVNSGAICPGSIFTITPSGATAYTISGGSFTVSPSANTAYTITGTNILGCLSPPAIANVQVNPQPTLTIAGNSSLCAGQQANLGVTGANSYTWSNSAIGNSVVVSPSATAIYSVTGMSSSGCLNTETIQITIFPGSTISANSGAICPTDTFVITPSGAFIYSITGGAFSVTPLSTTYFTVTGTDANGCNATPAIATVSVVNSITIAVSGATNVCAGNSSTLVASGAGSFAWSPGPVNASVIITPTGNITYTVYAASGLCADTALIQVKLLALPVVKASASASLICSGETVTLAASGALTYVWSGGATVVTPTAPIQYTVAGQDKNGCEATAIVAVNVQDCTGLSESVGSNVAVYPNPNNGIFVLQAPVGSEYSIFDGSGRFIGAGRVTGDSTTVNLNDSARGLYLLRVNAENKIRNIRVIRD